LAYTLRSAIGRILSSVCLSVRPSVCNAVHFCGSQGRCTRLKLVPASLLAGGQIHIFCHYRHFCCRMYRLAAKRTRKTSRRKREREFFETQKTTRAFVYSALLTVENLTRSTSLTLLVTLEWIAFRCIHELYPEESDCVYIQPFIGLNL